MTSVRPYENPVRGGFHASHLPNSGSGRPLSTLTRTRFMSSSHAESLFCLECEERQPFPSDMLLYQPPGKESAPAYRDGDWAVMLTDRVWCFDCERPAYVERIPSGREFQNAAQFRDQPDLPHPPHVEDELLDLDDSQFLFLRTHLVGRRPTRRCLTCGSRSVRLLQVAIDRVVNLRHPFCEGAMRLDRVFFPGIRARTLRWFDVGGEQIEVQCDRF